MFYYKGQDRDDALDADMGGVSFYALMKTKNVIYKKINQHFTTYRDDFAKHTVMDGGVSYRSMLELFNNLLGDRDADLNDDRIAAELFTNNNVAIQAITGSISAVAFVRLLNTAIEATAASFRQNLAALRESFILTYRHADIVALLGTTKVVTKPSLVKSRVFETAYILDRILDKKRFLATSLLLGIMHVERFNTYKDNTDTRTLYNQGSALFTLLTFSYTPALSVERDSDNAEDVADSFRAAIRSGKTSKDDLAGQLMKQNISKDWAEEVAAKGVTGLEAVAKSYDKRKTDNDTSLLALKMDEVQYGWKIFGSCLGIDDDLLPTTYAEAKTLWGQFIQSGYPRVVSENSDFPAGRKAMLKIFNDALEPETLSQKLDFASFGLTLKASALTEMAYVGPVARLVGWYTSSNHAGLTCGTCQTVHGSRVSLVRLWHSCPTCKKVYCAECASGRALYVTIAVGAVMGGWWAAGSMLYGATVGWLVGAGTGRTASQFFSRKCCDTQTEALY